MRLLIFFVATLFFLANAAHAKEIWTVKNTDDANLTALSMVWKMHSFPNKKDGVSVRVFETGGGDPAMNGNRIVVIVASERMGGPVRVWETGVDVSWVKSVELRDRTLVLSVTEHYFSNGGAKIRNAVYKLTYDVESGGMVVRKSADGSAQSLHATPFKMPRPT